MVHSVLSSSLLSISPFFLSFSVADFSWEQSNVLVVLCPPSAAMECEEDLLAAFSALCPAPPPAVARLHGEVPTLEGMLVYRDPQHALAAVNTLERLFYLTAEHGTFLLPCLDNPSRLWCAAPYPCLSFTSGAMKWVEPLSHCFLY